MDSPRLDAVVDCLQALIPLFRQKIFAAPARRYPVKPSTSQFTILRIVSESGPLPISRIGARLAISKSNMTPLVNNLIRSGLLKKTNDAKDGRVLNIELTAPGRSLLAETRKLMREHTRKKLRALSASDSGRLLQALGTVREIVAKLE